MRNLLLAGLGGFIGSAARYGTAVALIRTSATLRFPVATLLVNLVGSFLIGVLLAGSLSRGWLGEEARVFLLIGVLGGFTTFSSFSMDTLQLWRDAGPARASLNVALNVVLCLAAVWLGDAVSRTLAR